MARPTMVSAHSRTEHHSEGFWCLAPGIALSAAVAIIAVLSVPWIVHVFPIPAMVLALIVGVSVNPVARRPMFQPGITFCVKTVLRWSVALLGLRIALGEIIALGVGTATLVLAAMVCTVASGFLFARLFGQSEYFGALAGVGTAVCGASATLATSAVLPGYPGKQADVAFIIIAVNLLSTAAMVLYPPLCAVLAFDATTTGIMLGATIHDVAQVAGAGYAVSEQTGNIAVIVKLFRVLLLFPLVLAVAYYFLRPRPSVSTLRGSIPGFALAFIVLCGLNSILDPIPAAQLIYAPVKRTLSEISTWGLLIAIGALGLGTSIKAVAALGFRPTLTLLGTTSVILCIVAAVLALS